MWSVQRSGVTVFVIALICASQANGASRKFLIEVVSLSQTFHFVVGQPTTTIYDANIILPEGSHLHIQCLQNAPDCGSIDGSSKVQAKRQGKSLEIYTANGRRKYEIVGSW